MAATVFPSNSQLHNQEVLLTNSQNYDPKTTCVKHEKSSLASVNKATFHSPSNSDTSSLFSTTVDCSSFSSRSDASSFAKEEVSPVTQCISVSVSSSIDFMPSSARLKVEEAEQGAGLKTDELNSRESGYFEFSFVEGKPVGNDGGGNRINACSGNSTGAVQDSDAYENFPVWTDRTRYCSTDIHSCINPCFDQADDSGGEQCIRTSRKKKLAKSLGSVISRHLALSPGPTFRKSSYDKFRSRLALDHPSPLSENVPPTPSRTYDNCRDRSGYSSSPSPGSIRRYMNSPRLSFAKEKVKLKAAGELSASTSGKATSLYGTSPKRVLESKSLGCLKGIASGMSKAMVSAEETSLDESKGPLYFATEESVHGGKGRCLPSPRLSFGHGKALKNENDQPVTSSVAMVIPSSTVHGHLHCVVRNELPSFTFVLDGLEEVLVAKAVRPGSPDISPETGDLIYMFYSWKPKGRLKANWKQWVRKDKSTPDPIGKMIVTSRVVPSEIKDGNDAIELEFVLSDGVGTFSPRLSFSTWETGSSPYSCKAPSPAPGFGFPSPFSVVTPSPGRLHSAASSRYVSMSMVPTSLTSPRVERTADLCSRRAKKSQCATTSPLRPKSDDEKSCFHDAWSDSESAELPEQAELAAVIIKSVAPGDRNCSWETKSLKNNSMSSARKSYYRRFSLPGRSQATETKENQTDQDNKRISSSSSRSGTKLRELMGVKADFGKDDDDAAEESTTMTVVLPAGNHGLPRYGAGGPQPLVDRYRAGGRCDCGSWDLGCGLTILENEQKQKQESEQEQQFNKSRGSLVKIHLQGKTTEKNAAAVMNLGEVTMDGLFPVSFQAPLSYLQAFASAVAVLYSKGPRVMECSSSSSSSSSTSSSRKESLSLMKPPRIPLKPLMSSQRRIVALATGYYCSPPPACLLDRL